jgi:hypothetical protein
MKPWSGSPDKMDGMTDALANLQLRLARLPPDDRDLGQDMRGAILAADSDSVSCAIRARRVLEHVVRDVYQRRIGKPSGAQPLEGVLAKIVKEGHFPEELAGFVGAVKGLANRVAHDRNKSYPAEFLIPALDQALMVLEWYFRHELPAPEPSPEEMANASQRIAVPAPLEPSAVTPKTTQKPVTMPKAPGKLTGEAHRSPATDEGDGPGTRGAVPAVQTAPVELVIDRDFDTYTQEDQEQLLAAIKHLLGMKGDVRVSKRRGSVRLLLDLTPEQSERLDEAVRRGELQRFDVVGLRRIGHGKISADSANPDKVMILDLLRYEGPLTAEQISRSLGIPLARTRKCLRLLEDSAVGVIRRIPGSTPRLYESV